MAISSRDAAAGVSPAGNAFSILIAGVICGFLAIVLSIGHGGLLFSSQLQVYLPISIGLALFSTAVMAAIGALTSSTKGVVAICQEIPVVALTAVVGAVAAALPAEADESTRLVTVMAAIGLSTAATGAIGTMLGPFRLGGLIRFAPYPVVGGFLAGTGWLIITGGVGLVANEAVTLGLVERLDDPVFALKLGLTAAFVAALFAGQARGRGALTVPAIILAALLAFNIGAAVMGETVDTLRSEGWLIQLPESGRLWPPVTFADLGKIDWRAISAGLIAMPAVVILTIMALLMNATGIELDSQQDVDLDRELTSVGAMNLVAGAGMGLPGYHSVSLTLLATRLGAASQWVGIIVALLAAAALAFGNIVLNLVPAVILGGVLVWIGGSLLIEWLFRSYARLHLREYAIILIIFVVIVGIDFATGILAGLIAAILLFVFEYGRLDVVRHEMIGSGFQSTVETTEKRRAALREHGAAILIIRLQGFLFFGTADRLRRRIQQRIAAGKDRPLRFLLVDFRRVYGIDSSGVLSFIRLQQIASRAGVTLVFTGMSQAAREAIERGGLDGRVRIERDLDRGLKWCEDALLAEVMPELLGNANGDLADLLADVVGDRELGGKVAQYFERTEVAPGTRLIDEATPSDDILFVESGQAGVEMDSGKGDGPIRLATVGPGAIVGEMAFYSGEPRSASITAEEAMVVWVFSRDSLKRLEAEMPEAASRFHQGIATMLARRLMQTNRLVRLLAD